MSPTYTLSMELEAFQSRLLQYEGDGNDDGEEEEKKKEEGRRRKKTAMIYWASYLSRHYKDISDSCFV